MMEIVADEWLATIFGCPVFRISTDGKTTPADQACLAQLIKDRVTGAGEAFCYAKVDTGEVSAIRQLTAAGLYVVDVNVSFSLDPAVENVAAERSPVVLVREIQPADYEPTLAIAASCFRYSRFHLDPLVSSSIANLVKREWIQNYILHKRGEQLIVAVKGDRPVGFLAAIASTLNNQRVFTIDLIGVANDHQGQGIGWALTANFINRYKDQCDLLQVGTQVANIPSMRLYQKLGFHISRSQYVLHGHFAGALG
jgi:ribosomal protein S18 acetylase RimI-like enzyme